MLHIRIISLPIQFTYDKINIQNRDIGYFMALWLLHSSKSLAILDGATVEPKVAMEFEVCDASEVHITGHGVIQGHPGHRCPTRKAL